jgi:hypothetical protein
MTATGTGSGTRKKADRDTIFLVPGQNRPEFVLNGTTTRTCPGTNQPTRHPAGHKGRAYKAPLVPLSRGGTSSSTLNPEKDLTQ